MPPPEAARARLRALRCYPALAVPLGIEPDPRLDAWLHYAWGVLMDLDWIIDDLDEDTPPDHRNALAWKFAGYLSWMEQELAGARTAAVHHGPLALEYGLGHLVRLSGTELVELLDLFGPGAGAPDPARVLWEMLRTEFPGTIPPAESERATEARTRVLERWAELRRRTGVPARLAEYYEIHRVYYGSCEGFRDWAGSA